MFKAHKQLSILYYIILYYIILYYIILYYIILYYIILYYKYIIFIIFLSHYLCYVTSRIVPSSLLCTPLHCGLYSFCMQLPSYTLIYSFYFDMFIITVCEFHPPENAFYYHIISFVETMLTMNILLLWFLYTLCSVVPYTSFTYICSVRHFSKYTISHFIEIQST